MTDDDSSTNASMAAQHSVVPRTQFKVAPTDGSTKFNTIRIPLIPVACWRLNDPAFGFDSSFVSPTFRDELGTLSGIVAANPDCPATLFGHCDPAGGDAINKTLGDRRVIAIYALLTRQPDLWESLYSDPQVGDRWGTHAIQTMLSSLVDSGGTPYYLGAIDGVAGTGTADAIKQFQGDDTELTANGRLDAPTRKKLFGAYMDWLCTAAPPERGPQSQPEPDPPGSAVDSAPRSAPKSDPQPATDAGTPPPSTFPMKPTDFLGGADAKDGDLPKMSLQSCGKFNPIVLLTAAEMQGYDEKSRNADDAPNRRVLMYFFAKGTKVDTNVWPCPKVREAGDACKTAFWPGGDAKRTNGAVKRLYKGTRDTMACRFYDRFARRSPCESGTTYLDWVTHYIPSGCDTSTLALAFFDVDGHRTRRVPLTQARTDDLGGHSFNLMPSSSDQPFSVQLFCGEQPMEHPIRISVASYRALASTSQSPQESRIDAQSSDVGAPVASAYDANVDTTETA